MSDANRHLKLRNTRQSDDQYAADSDDSVSSHSDAHSGGERAAVTNFEPQDDIARSTAEKNSRAYDLQIKAAAVTTSSSSSGGDDDDEIEGDTSPGHDQRMQYCGPNRLFYTPDTDGHRHLEEAEKAGMPYSILKEGANDDDCDDGDDADDDENSDSGGGQFGYSCSRSGGSHRPGYGYSSNGYTDGIEASGKGKRASEMISTSAAGGSGSDKQRQNSGSPPEHSGNSTADKSAADCTSKAKRQQQQQSRQMNPYGCSAADQDSNEPNTEAVHYGAAFNAAAQSSGKGKKGGKRREQGVRQTIKAQDVAGNRGQDDIDSLLDFIESNPGARGKRGMTKSSGQLQTQNPQQPQLQQQKQKKPKDARAHSIGATVAVEDAQQEPSRSLSPLATAAPTPMIAQPEQQPLQPSPPPPPQQLQKQHQVLRVAPEQPRIAEERPAGPVTEPSAGSVLNGGGSSSEEATHEPPKTQIIFTDFDTLSAPEPAREVAFSVVVSKKERKHKRRQADPPPQIFSQSHQPQHPQQYHHHQQLVQQHRQASAHSAPPRVQNGGHAATVPPHAAAPPPSTAAPATPGSGSVPARTSSSSRSDSPTASEASASAAGSAQHRPCPLNPAQYEQLLRQKAQENALLRRDLDSCSPNHSQLISFLYSLC